MTFSIKEHIDQGALFSMLLFLCMSFFNSTIAAQPGPPYVDDTLYFSFLAPNGDFISPESSTYTFTFELLPSPHSPPELLAAEFNDGIFKIPLKIRSNGLFPTSFFPLRITISYLGLNMQIYCRNSLQNIPFDVGTFEIPISDAPLFSTIQPGTFCRINNSSLQQYDQNYTYSAPSYGYDFHDAYDYDHGVDSCKLMAAQLEQMHGGTNWALNTCADVLLEENIDIFCPERTGDYSVSITPYLHSAFIKHEFFKADQYLHRFSITTNNGKTWDVLFEVENLWHVYLVYFPNINRLGIEAQDFMMLSDVNNLNSWTYFKAQYFNDNSELPVSRNNLLGLLLKNHAGSDSQFNVLIIEER